MATDHEAREVSVLVLNAIADGRDIDELVELVRPFHRDGSTFPARPLLEAAADAFAAGGWSRHDRLGLDEISERYLPEWPARGNARHSKRRHAVHAAILITAGAEPEDTGWWSFDDLWLQALHALVVMVRAGADHRDTTVKALCHELLQFRK